MLKLISLYISHQGDINILYDNLISKSQVLDKLSVSMLISNIIILKNDPVTKTQKLIKSYFGESDYEEIDKIIDQGYQFRDHLTKVKDYFDTVFQKARHEKVMLNLDRQILNLGKKKRREDLPALMPDNSKPYNFDLLPSDLKAPKKKGRQKGTFKVSLKRSLKGLRKDRPRGKFTRLMRSLE